MSYNVAINRQALPARIAAVALEVGDLVLLNAATQWVKADANGTGTYPALGIVTVRADVGGRPEVCRAVEIGGYSGLTIGAAVYLSETAGGVTQTATAYHQQIGMALDDTTIAFSIVPQPAENLTEVESADVLVLTDQSSDPAAESGKTKIYTKSGVQYQRTSAGGVVSEIEAIEAEINARTTAVGIIEVGPEGSGCPYITIASAISAAEALASAGRMPSVIVNEGDYTENLTITQSIYMIAVGQVNVTGDVTAYSGALFVGEWHISGTSNAHIIKSPQRDIWEANTGDSLQSIIDAAQARQTEWWPEVLTIAESDPFALTDYYASVDPEQSGQALYIAFGATEYEFLFTDGNGVPGTEIEVDISLCASAADVATALGAVIDATIGSTGTEVVSVSVLGADITITPLTAMWDTFGSEDSNPMVSHEAGTAWYIGTPRQVVNVRQGTYTGNVVMVAGVDIDATGQGRVTVDGDVAHDSDAFWLGEIAVTGTVTGAAKTPPAFGALVDARVDARDLASRVLVVRSGKSVSDVVATAAASIGYTLDTEHASIAITFPDGLTEDDSFVLIVRTPFTCETVGGGFGSDWGAITSEIDTGAEAAAYMASSLFGAYYTAASEGAVLTITAEASPIQPVTFDITGSTATITAVPADGDNQYWFRNADWDDTQVWDIVWYEGAETSCDPAPPPGVRVRRFDETYKPIRERFPLPVSVGLVAIEFDDSMTNIFTTGASGFTGGADSLVTYLASNGVPVSHAPVADWSAYGTRNTHSAVCTPAQIRTLNLQTGAEIMCQTMNHPTSSTTVLTPADDDIDGWTRELVFSKLLMEGLSCLDRDTTIGWESGMLLPDTPTQNKLGLNIRGLSLSGGTGGVQAQFASEADWKSARGRMVTENYQFCIGSQVPYNSNGSYGSETEPVHGGTYQQMPQHLQEYGTLADMVESMATPGCRTHLIVDTTAVTDANKTNLKTALDALIAARNEGKIMLVTVAGLYNAITTAAMPSAFRFAGDDYDYPSTGPLWGGIVNGDFAAYADDVVLPAVGTVGYMGSWGHHGSAGASKVTTDGGVKCYSLAAGKYISAGRRCWGGHEYLIRFRAKRAAEGATLYPLVFCTNDAGTAFWIRLKSLTPTDAFATYYRAFGLPLWVCPNVRIGFYSVTQGTEIAKVECVQVG